MDKKNLKDFHDNILRAGLCFCWVAAIPMMLMFFIMSTAADTPEEQNSFMIKAVISFGVLILGASAHCILLNIKDDEKKNG